MILLLPPATVFYFYLKKKEICFFPFPQGDQGFVPGYSEISPQYHPLSTWHFSFSYFGLWGTVVQRTHRFINSGHFLRLLKYLIHLAALCPLKTCSGGCGKHLAKLSSHAPNFSFTLLGLVSGNSLVPVFLLLAQSL